MANISKIKTLDGTVYTINDDNAVHKTGNETIAGDKSFSSNTFLKHNSIEHTAIPASDSYRGLYFTDKNDTTLARIMYYKNTSGTTGLTIGLKANNGADYLAGLSISATTDGEVKAATSSSPALDDNSNKIATTAWIRSATGNTTLNAATATKATQDEDGRNIASGYMWKESYERIAGTSAVHKDLDDYTSAGFYNIATTYVDNVPVGIGTYAVLLVYPWKPSAGDGTLYSSQEITEAFSSTKCRRWIRKQNNGVWSEWKQIAFATSWSSTKLYNTTLAEATTATSTNPYTLTTTDFGTDYKELFIRLGVSTAQSTAATLRFKITFSGNSTLIMQTGNGISTSANNFVCIKAGNYDCLLFGLICRSAGNPSVGAWYSLNGNTNTYMPQFAGIDDTITKIEIWSTSSTVTQLPSGMTIMIWGRK